MIFFYLFICMCFAAFFAGLETGLLSINRMLLQDNKKNSWSVKAAKYLLQKPERLLGTALIGYNIANVAAAVLLTNYLVGIGFPVWIGILLLTFVYLVFNDIVPKSFLSQFADTVALALSPFIFIFYLLFLPVYLVLNSLVKLIMFLTGQSKQRREDVKSKKDLLFLIHLAGKKVGLSLGDQKIIEDIFDFQDQTAREVMIPCHKMPVLSIAQSVDELIEFAKQMDMRFIPVYSIRTDNIVGFVDTLKLFAQTQQNLRDIIDKPVFFPEIKTISSLLLAMNQRQLNVVFLTDEFGGVSGMITHRQIIKEIVHHIPRESETAADTNIVKIGKGQYRVKGLVDLEDLSHVLGVPFRKGYNTTISGLICERLGIIPEKGQIYEESGYLFKISSSSEKYIKELEIIKKK